MRLLSLVALWPLRLLVPIGLLGFTLITWVLLFAYNRADSRQHAIDDLENLKSEIKSLRKENESALAEVDKIKTDAEREKKSSMHVAATLAATNTARQAELEMSIEKMQKEVCLFGSTQYAQVYHV